MVLFIEPAPRHPSLAAQGSHTETSRALPEERRLLFRSSIFCAPVVSSWWLVFFEGPHLVVLFISLVGPLFECSLTVFVGVVAGKLLQIPSWRCDTLPFPLKRLVPPVFETKGEVSR